MIIQGEDFLVLGEQWGYYPSTTEHLLKRLVGRNRFLWVNEMGCRAPEWNIYTLQRAWGKLVHWGVPALRGPVEEGMMVYSPPILPLRPAPPVRWWNRRVLARGITARLGKLGFDKPILFTMSPIAAEVVRQLDLKHVVYYIVDNYEEMPNWYSKYVRELETQMLDRADLVFATSQPLVEKKSRAGRVPILLPQGVEFEHFHGAVAEGVPEPPELAGIPHPRLLFMGLLAPWVDVDLLAHVARVYPNASLVLLGPVRTNVDALRNEPNAHFLGQHPYGEIPRYLAHCDAALIPFRQNALTRYVNPLKLLEYMASGLPVVSTALPHVTMFDDVVYCARTPEEFIANVGRALTEFSAERRARSIAAARRNSWESRAEQFSNVLRESLSGRAAQPA